MKFKDLMLDLATGDASSNDPYIAEAVGQVKVASAYFEAATTINELLEDNNLQVVQEVAKAGLPTDKTGSAALGNTAVKKGLEGLFKAIRETADKTKKQVDKDMKVLLTIGKKYGVAAPSGDNFATFAESLSKAIIDKADSNKLSLPDARFLKAKTADELATSYTKGMVHLTSAFGYDITAIFKDSTISKEIKPIEGCECETINCLAGCLSDGAKLMKVGEVSKEKYTESIKASDIKDIATDLYIIMSVSEAVTDALKGQDKSAAANVANLFSEDADSKKISKAVSKIGDNMKEWTDNVKSISDAITKAFTDSVYSLSEALKK